MSYILDALKKLENEKQKKTRGDGIVNITGELFKDVPRRTSGGNYRKIAAVVVVVSLATFGATWFLLKSGKGGERLKSRPAVLKPSVVKPAPLPLPIQPPVVPAPVTPPQAPPVAPAVPAVPAEKPAAASPVVSDVEKAPALGTAPKQTKRVNVRRAKVAQPVKVEKTVTPLVAAPADIKVSGIAWQDERRARRAVVNGFLMQEGASVSGARITEIFQDRVRFSKDNGVFEIPLMSSSLQGAGK